jgi:inorganic pyrophosphatase
MRRSIVADLGASSTTNLRSMARRPGVVIPCRALALIEVDQRGQDGRGRVRNDRLIAILIAARREEHETQPDDLPTRVREELHQFSLAATALEGKELRK